MLWSFSQKIDEAVSRCYMLWSTVVNMSKLFVTLLLWDNIFLTYGGVSAWKIIS